MTYEIDKSIVLKAGTNWMSNGLLTTIEMKGLTIQVYDGEWVRIDIASPLVSVMFFNEEKPKYGYHLTRFCYTIPPEYHKVVKGFLEREKDKHLLFKSIPYVIDFAERLATYMKLMLG